MGLDHYKTLKCHGLLVTYDSLRLELHKHVSSKHIKLLGVMAKNTQKNHIYDAKSSRKANDLTTHAQVQN